MDDHPKILRGMVFWTRVFWDSTNWCKSIVGNVASQLFYFSLRQAIPTGLNTRWELDLKPVKFKTRPNKARSFENVVMS